MNNNNNEKRKKRFNDFSWKIINILNKPNKELNREEKSLYNNWIEDVEDFGIVVIPQNKILELIKEEKVLKLMTVGIFNEEKLISGMEIILSFENESLNNYKINHYYPNEKIEEIINNSFQKIFQDMKGKKLQNSPFDFAYKLLESDTKGEVYLKINQLNEELGKNIKDYLLKKNSL